MAAGSKTMMFTLKVRDDGTAVIKKTDKALGGFGKRTDQVSKKAKGLSASLGKTIGLLATMGISSYALMRGISSAIKTYIDFEHSMSNVASVAGATTKEMKQLESQSRKLAATSVFTASEAAAAQYHLASAGMEVNEIIAAQKGVMDLAAATQHDLAETGRVVASTLSQFSLDAAESARVADVFASAISGSQANMEKLGTSMTYVGPVAKGVGYTLEETTSALMAFYNAGLDGSMAGTALRAALTRLLDQTPEITRVLKDLGVNVFDNSGKMKSFADIVDVLSEAGAGAEEIMKLFGLRAGPGMIAVIAKGGDAIRGYREKLDDTGKAGRMAAQQMDNLQGDLDKLSSQVEDSAIAFVEELAPALSDFVQNMTSMIKTMSDFWIPVFDDFLDLIGDVAKFGMSDLNTAALEVANQGIPVLTKRIKSLKEEQEESTKAWVRADNAVAGFFGLINLPAYFQRSHAENRIASITTELGTLEMHLKKAVRDKGFKDLEDQGASLGIAMGDVNFILKANKEALKKSMEHTRGLAKAQKEAEKAAKKAGKAAEKAAKAAAKAEKERMDSLIETADDITDALEDWADTYPEVGKAALKANAQEKALMENALNLWYDYEKTTVKYKEEALRKKIELMRDYGATEEQIALSTAEYKKEIEDQKLTEFGTFIDGIKAGYDDLLEKEFSWGEQGKKIFKTFTGSLTSAFSNSFVAIIKGDWDSLEDAWQGFLDSMVRAFADMLAELAIKWAASEIVSLISGGSGPGNIVGTAVQVAAQQAGGGPGGGPVQTGIQGYQAYQTATQVGSALTATAIQQGIAAGAAEMGAGLGAAAELGSQLGAAAVTEVGPTSAQLGLETAGAAWAGPAAILLAGLTMGGEGDPIKGATDVIEGILGAAGAVGEGIGELLGWGSDSHAPLTEAQKIQYKVFDEIKKIYEMAMGVGGHPADGVFGFVPDLASILGRESDMTEEQAQSIISLFKGKRPEFESIDEMEQFLNQMLSISHYGVGTPYVPQTMPAIVHEGERILSKSDNKALIEAVTTQNQGITINVSGSMFADDNFIAWLYEKLNTYGNRLYG